MAGSNWQPPADPAATRPQTSHAGVYEDAPAGIGPGEGSTESVPATGTEASPAGSIEMRTLGDVEIVVVPSSASQDPGISSSSHSETTTEPPSIIVIEDPSGNIYLGVDPPRWEKELAAREAQRAQQAPTAHEGENYDWDPTFTGEGFQFSDDHLIALVARRRKGVLFLLGMDMAYLVFISILPFVAPYPSPPPSPPPPGAMGGTDGEEGTGGESSSDSGFGFLERMMLQLAIFLVIDVLGIVACTRKSPGFITLFVVLLSFVTIITAVQALSPLLVFRMIIIMLSLQLRASLMMLQPETSGRGSGLLGCLRSLCGLCNRCCSGVPLDFSPRRRAAAQETNTQEAGPATAAGSSAPPPIV